MQAGSESLADAGTGVSAIEFRDALSRAVTPVTVIATKGPAGLAGVTCSAVCSVCDTPPTILFCINRRSAANSVIKENGVISVNWLNSEQSELSQLFAGAGAVPMHERFTPNEWGAMVTGVPYSKGAVLSLDCQVLNAMEIGTHSVFLAKVLASAQADERDPLVYCRRSYATTASTLN